MSWITDLIKRAQNPPASKPPTVYSDAPKPPTSGWTLGGIVIKPPAPSPPPPIPRGFPLIPADKAREFFDGLKPREAPRDFLIPDKGNAKPPAIGKPIFDPGSKKPVTVYDDPGPNPDTLDTTRKQPKVLNSGTHELVLNVLGPVKDVEGFKRILSEELPRENPRLEVISVTLDQIEKLAYVNVRVK